MAEDILHFGAVRYRLSGVGNLKHQVISLDDTITEELKPLPMQLNPGREPLRLSNSKAQRARIKVYTDQIGEKVIINRIIIFVKPIWTQYPG